MCDIENPDCTEEKLHIQRDKMRNGYKALDKDSINALKRDILSCFDSDDMRSYLSEHFFELNSWDLIEIIVGALKPLEFKLRTMQMLATWFPCPFDKVDSDYDFEPYVNLYEKGFKEMKASENTVFLLNRYRFEDKIDNTLMIAMPFFSFDAAIRFVKEKTEHIEFDWDEIETELTWFEIEKWVGEEPPSLIATYTVSKHGEIWDYSGCDDTFHMFGVYGAMSLNLPVPFHAGDVITIDCTPFAPTAHGIIVGIGDNHDCCSVQCLYLKKNGTLGIGALKHSDVFDYFTPSVSPLYKAKKVIDDLTVDEHYMLEVGNLIADMQTKVNKKSIDSEYNQTLQTKVLMSFTNDWTPNNIIEKLQNIQLC